MDPDPLSFVIFIIAASLFGMTVAAEIAFALIERNQLQEDEANAHRLRLVQTLLNRPADLLVAFTLSKSLGVLLIMGLLPVIVPASSNRLALFGTVLAVWIALNTLQVGIRALVQRRATWFAIQLARFVQCLNLLFRPFAMMLRRIGEAIAGEEIQISRESLFLTDDGLRLLMNIHHEENSIQETEKQMIAGILDLGDTTVREIMVPRIDIVALSVETSLQVALDVIIAAGHSRIPIYEGSADRIIGLLYAKDILKCFRDQRVDVPIRDLLRPAYFVPASKKVDRLFHEMQKQRVHMAVIVDEYGGTAGLVTIEDLLEEIVGEIQDEYDPDEETLVELIGANTYVLNGRLGIDALSELLGIEIEEDSVDTLGGLMFLLAERVPEQGRTVIYEHWKFTVLSVEGHRIEQVRAEPIAPSDVEPSDICEPVGQVSSHNRNSVLNLSASE